MHNQPLPLQVVPFVCVYLFACPIIWFCLSVASAGLHLHPDLGCSETHYIDMMPHNPLGPVSTAASIHFAAAVPNFAWLEDNFDPNNLHGQWDKTVFPKVRSCFPTASKCCRPTRSRDW